MSICSSCSATIEGTPRFCPVCGKEIGRISDTATSVQPADRYIDAVFAQKFRVHKLLGEGGMGRVYSATQLSLDKVICLKVLRRELANDPETKARFEREAKAASRLSHPHSIQVIDFGAGEDGELYIAMELVNGRDLHSVIDKDFPLPEARIRDIMSQVLDALSEAHAQKVIHRDLKPENIMIGKAGGDYVKVLDFGIAQIQDGSANRLTKAGLVCGTPEYMSPEQARGETLDARSDIYSAGIILYQMAVGKLPFHAATPMGFVTKHLTEIPKPAHEVRPEVSPALSDLIARCMAKDRRDRPASATAMRDELLATAGGTSAAVFGRTLPSPVSGEVPVRDQPGSPRWVGWAAGGAAACAVAGLGLFLVLRSGPPAAPPKPIAVAAPVPVAPIAAPAGPKADEFQRYMDKGKKAFEAQSWDEALSAYERAAYVDKSQAEPYKRIGLIYQMRGDKAKAAAHFQKYVDSVPTPPDADRIRALITAQ